MSPERAHAEQQPDETRSNEHGKMALRVVQASSEYEWMEDALCRDSDTAVFFQNDESDAKSICAHCEVQSECLDYALKYRIEDGVWGGYSEKERRRVLRQRAKGTRK